MTNAQLRETLNALCLRTPPGLADWPLAKVQRYRDALQGSMRLLSRFSASDRALRHALTDMIQFFPEEQR